MKNILIIIPLFLILTGCPSKEEIKQSMEDLKTKKSDATLLIKDSNLSLESLLKLHEYFFNFAEKVHVLSEEKDAKKLVQSLIKDSGARAFCNDFIIPTALWKNLDQNCSQGGFYKCSPEIKEYPSILSKLKESIDPEFTQKLNTEAACL